MTIVVAYKYAPNPQDASVSNEGVVDWGRAKPGVSEYDPVAIQVGRDLATAAGTEVVGVSVGTSVIGTSLAKKNAMSRGLDRGIVVADDSTQTWNPVDTAAALAALVGRVPDARLLLAGDSSIDDGARMMPTLVAGFLQWPCFEEVTSVEAAGDGWLLTQAIPGGTRTITVPGPVVVATTSDAVAVKVPSMKEVLAAGKKPVEIVPATDVAPVTSGVEITGHSKPTSKARLGKVFSGDAAVSELVSALRTEGVL